MADCDWLCREEHQWRWESGVEGQGGREVGHVIDQAESSPQERQDKWLHTVYAQDLGRRSWEKVLGLASTPDP